MALPPLPRIELVLDEDRSPEADAGFLRLRRRRLRVRRPDGSLSEPFTYDSVDRQALDAVVVAAHYADGQGRRMVYLRSAIRPPAWHRPESCRPMPEKDTLGVLWELPAGLVESDECSLDGLRRCAARELGEELGFHLPPDLFEPLGPATFPTPGVIGERHHFFHVEVEPARRQTPSEDGSVLEQQALIAAVELAEALQAAGRGEIEDAKTELGLWRLAERI